MKKLPVYLLMALFFSAPALFAQEELEEMTPQTPPKAKVDAPAANTSTAMPEADLKRKANIYESNESMSKGIQNAVVVEVPSSKEKLVDDVWKKFIKDYGGKTKRTKGNRKESTTTGAEIVGINGVKNMTIYSATSPGPNGDVELSVWFDLGEDFLDSGSKSQYEEAERMLQKFAHEVRVEDTREELKDAEKTLKDYEGDLKSLERQKDGYHRDIANYEKKIEEAKEKIVTNDQQQVDTGQKIELQKQLVDEIDRRLKKLKKM